MIEGTGGDGRVAGEAEEAQKSGGGGGSEGKPNRYAYVSTVANASMAPRFTGVAKLDLTAPHDECCVGRLYHGLTHGGGEAFFVPRHKDPSLCDGEDDGFLVTFVHDESATEGGSAMVVYDAKTMSSTPVARVPLPHRVPYGFHCLHLDEEQFQSQLQMSDSDQAMLAKPDILTRQQKGTKKAR
ncbi:hypothetical protein WJX73_003043 [Symbiochloris irregularis]|uniref:carotenoid 9,10-dioxygenase n=1 Tax=Symbiochloris irregularis TaxID=706552 RepID=A0AAW1P6P4_9CHLO